MDNNEEKNLMEEPQTGYIEPVEIDHEMRTAYIDYSMSVIVSRYDHLEGKSGRLHFNIGITY